MLKKLIYTINDRYYFQALNFFNVIVVIHFLEHVAQMMQLYVLHLSRPQCLGLLGTVYPWLMHQEGLHYAHALFMLVMLYLLRIGFYGGLWWDAAMWFSFYHHLEHAILLSQSFMGVPMPLRWSLGSFLIPRLELHFIYNLIAIGLMMMAFKAKIPPSREGIKI